MELTWNPCTDKSSLSVDLSTLDTSPEKASFSTLKATTRIPGTVLCSEGTHDGATHGKREEKVLLWVDNTEGAERVD